tara:strand:- start:420 stop:1025 length:606 start_codon:yes stop_codon:yes gene_type:complete
MNFIAPLVLSILIHLGIVISFSNIFSINFDQFNIESRKPIAAYLILEQPKIKKIETTYFNQKKESLFEEEEKLKPVISDAALALKQIEKLRETKIPISQDQQKVLAQSDLEKFSFIIKTQVLQNWKRPKNFNLNLKTEIQINLVPTGEILSAKLLKSSGNQIFDESAISAIKKVNNFEGLNMPMSIFDRHFREFVLIFSPE